MFGQKKKTEAHGEDGKTQARGNIESELRLASLPMSFLVELSEMVFLLCVLWDGEIVVCCERFESKVWKSSGEAVTLKKILFHIMLSFAQRKYKNWTFRNICFNDSIIILYFTVEISYDYC